MMNPNEDDAELLRRYAEEGSNAAFAELVRRHVGLVYAAALRQLGGAVHRAEEVTQGVFIDLARKAGALARRTEIVGWLYTSTHHAAAKLKRDEQRRQHREQEAHTMQEISSDSADRIDWDRLRPVLDSAMHELGERDRAVILLRFFQGRRFAEVGHTLGMSEDGARMRTERALEKLHGLLARRKITSTTAALGLLLANQPAVAVPAGLAASVAGAALAGTAGTAALTAGGMTGIFFSTMTTKIGWMVGLTAAGLGLGTAVWQNQEAQAARSRAETVAQERDALREQVAGMRQRVTLETERRAALERTAEANLTVKSKVPPMTARGSLSGPNGMSAAKEEPAAAKWSLMPSSGSPEEDRKRIREINGKNVDASYAALYQKLGWTAEQREQFKAMILDCEESGSALFKKAVAVAREKNPAMDRAEQYEIFEASQAQLRQEQQAEARRRFGAAVGDALEQFQIRQPVRFLAQGLTNERPSHLPPVTMTMLTPAEADQLTEIMASHAQGPVSKVELAALDMDAVVVQAQTQGLLNAAQAAVLRADVARAQAQQQAQRAQNTMPLAELKAKMGKP